MLSVAETSHPLKKNVILSVAEGSHPLKNNYIFKKWGSFASLRMTGIFDLRSPSLTFSSQLSTLNFQLSFSLLTSQTLLTSPFPLHTLPNNVCSQPTTSPHIGAVILPVSPSLKTNRLFTTRESDKAVLWIPTTPPAISADDICPVALDPTTVPKFIPTTPPATS
jgi:hypothetical protein